MKNLKKYLKVVFCFMAFALCGFMLAFNNALTANAEKIIAKATSISLERSTYNVGIKAVNVPKKVNAENGFKIPVLTSANILGGETIDEQVVRVTDTAGVSHDWKVKDADDEAGDTFFNQVGGFVNFKALNKGDYKVSYIVKSGEKVYFSNTYNVEVESVSYEINFADETGKLSLIPAKLKTNDSIELPVPTADVKGSETRGTALDTANISVTRNNAPVELNDSTGVFTKDATTGKLTLNVKTAGVYTVKYVYPYGDQPTKTYEISVTDSFTAPTSLSLTSNTTLPSMQIGQKDIKLNKPTFKDNIGNTNVAYNIEKIRIEKETNANIYQELSWNNLTFDFTMFDSTTNKGFKNATSYKDLMGRYRVVYTVVDAYGVSHTETFRTSEITVSNKPTIKMSYDYDVDENGNITTENVDTNYSTDLKMKYGSSELLVPAAYAEDSVTDYKDLTIVRTLKNKNSTKTYYIDNLKYDSTTGKLKEVLSGEEGFNYATGIKAGYTKDSDGYVTVNKGEVNKAVQFKFAEDYEVSQDGETFYLEYTAYSTSVKDRSQSTSRDDTSFTVVNGTTPNRESTTTVKITNLTDGKKFNSSDEVVVKVKAEDTAKEGTIADARLKNVVFYMEGTTFDASEFKTKLAEAINSVTTNYCHKLDSEAVLTKLQETYSTLKKAEATDADFKLGSLDGMTNVVVVAVSMNDSLSDGVAIASKKISVKNTTETSLPDAEVLADASDIIDGTTVSADKEFNQGDVISLPSVKFTDADDKELFLQARYYVLDSETDVAKLKPSLDTIESYTLVGNSITQAKLTARQTGNYYIVYSATDDAGNTSVVYFTLKVKEKLNPNLGVDAIVDGEETNSSTVNAKLGSVIDFNFTLNSDSGEDLLTDVDSQITMSMDNWSGFDKEGFSLTCVKVGTFKVTFTGTKDGETDERVITINVSAPAFAWNDDAEDLFDSIDKYATKDSDVLLPDVSTNLNGVVSVKVKAPGGADVTVEKVIENGLSKWKFHTDDNLKGTYTVTYTATSEVGGTISREIKIKVGDNVAPTISYEHAGDLAQDIKYDGKNDITVKFDVDKDNKKFVITATRNGKTIYSYDLKLSLSDRDDTDRLVENYTWNKLKYELTTENGTLKEEKDGDSITYTLSKAGTYTIKISAEDGYGNISPVESISFNLVSSDSSKDKADTVVGIVLIIVSLVVLAGVILFFTFTGKKGTSVKSKKNKKEEVVENKEDNTDAE